VKYESAKDKELITLLMATLCQPAVELKSAVFQTQCNCCITFTLLGTTNMIRNASLSRSC